MFVGLMIVLAFLSVSVSLDSKISLIIYFFKMKLKNNLGLVKAAVLLLSTGG